MLAARLVFSQCSASVAGGRVLLERLSIPIILFEMNAPTAAHTVLLRAVCWLLTVCCCVAGSAQSAGASAIGGIVVGSEKQLFIDDLFLTQATNVSLRLHPARKTGERILEANQPWENASLNWFSVLQHEGKFRMWYECYDVEGWPTTNDTSFCYAESVDGLRWTKPNLNLFSYHGSTSNNILFREIGPPDAHSRVHGAGVFLDPTATPDTRFKCVSQGMFARGSPPYRIAGMTSPDGLRWTRLPEPICEVFADSQYSTFWDATQESFVLYGRVNGRGRAIGRSLSRDFAHFEPPQLVLEMIRRATSTIPQRSSMTAQPTRT